MEEEVDWGTDHSEQMIRSLQVPFFQADPTPAAAATTPPAAEPAKAVEKPADKEEEQETTLNKPPSSALSAMISSTVQPMAEQIQGDAEEVVEEMRANIRSLSPDSEDGLRQRINAAPSPDENGKIKLTLKYNQVNRESVIWVDLAESARIW